MDGAAYVTFATLTANNTPSFTLDNITASGTWLASGTWTIPAVTLGGTVTSNGQSFSGTIANLGTVTTADINGGTLDGTVIGGASAAAGTFTTGTFGGDTIVSDTFGLNIGHATQLTVNSIVPEVQVLGTSTTGVDSTILIGNFSTTATSPAQLIFLKSDQGTIGNFALLDSGDTVGGIKWCADDGVDYTSVLASITVFVDGTSGSNDLPGRMVFATAADGAATTTDRWIIDSAGAFKPAADGSFDIGTTTLAVNNIHIDTGGVINFENGNATITHSTGLLTSNVDFVVPAEAYGTGWNGSNEAPTKNDVYDKIEGSVRERTWIYTNTAGATWTKPSDPNFKQVLVWVVSGGGGGGGAGTNSTIGGGGGGGASAFKIIAAATLGATETVTIGVGGTAGASGNNAGGAGGTSSFGAHVSCTGGAAGGAGSGTTTAAGGVATGGDYNGDGTDGGQAGTYTDSYRGYGGSPGCDQGWPTTIQDSISLTIPAAGILGQWAGAGCPRPPSWSAADYTGGAGGKFGGGGSGGQRFTASVAGGAGAQGVVVVIEQYY